MHSIWPSVQGQQAVDILYSTPSFLTNVYQNLDLNNLSLFEIISTGILYQDKIYLQNIVTNYSTVILSLYSIKYAIFVNLSMTTNILLCLSVESRVFNIGSLTIKSIEIDYYLVFSISKGYNLPYSLYLNFFALLQILYLDITSYTVLSILRKPYNHLSLTKVLVIPRYLNIGSLYSLRTILNLYFFRTYCFLF